MLGTNFPDYLSASRSGAAGVAAANKPNPELAYAGQFQWGSVQHHERYSCVEIDGFC